MLCSTVEQGTGRDRLMVNSLRLFQAQVVIRNLCGGVRSYQFVVIAVATLEIPGERPVVPFIFI